MRRAVDGGAVATIENERAYGYDSSVARATPDRFIGLFPALKRHAQLKRRAAAVSMWDGARGWAGGEMIGAARGWG